MLADLTPDEQNVIAAIFDRLDADLGMGNVLQWAISTFHHFIGILDFDAIFDAWAGVQSLADWE